MVLYRFLLVDLLASLKAIFFPLAFGVFILSLSCALFLKSFVIVAFIEESPAVIGFLLVFGTSRLTNFFGFSFCFVCVIEIFGVSYYIKVTSGQRFYSFGLFTATILLGFFI
jgi:hypothetical protein